MTVAAAAVVSTPRMCWLLLLLLLLTTTATCGVWWQGTATGQQRALGVSAFAAVAGRPPAISRRRILPSTQPPPPAILSECARTMSFLAQHHGPAARGRRSSSSVPTALRAVPGSSASSQRSLKPAALPLMDSGKALARSGELLIDLTVHLDLYGGALSASGAQLRNAGDCLAQAAASMRFKTGAELVADELREAATCLREAVAKLRQAAEEAEIDGAPALAESVALMVGNVDGCGAALESAGEALMKRRSVPAIGALLRAAGEELRELSTRLAELSPQEEAAREAAQRCQYAADRMVAAGGSLLPPDDDGSRRPKATGKGWLKGGS